MSDLEQVARESRSSIELTRNSKGYAWVVKIYHQDGQEAAALETIQHVDEQLRARYGREAE